MIPVCGAVAALAASCAQVEGPRGGEPDRSPPYVIATEPEAMAVVPGWDGPVVIRFNERISQQRVEQSVVVSPEQGEVRVDKGRRELRIRVEGGWKPGRIYRVEVLPVIRDLFNNTRQEPIDLIFSTGPPIPNTALAGRLTDRLTGKPVAEARVEATRRLDSVTYVAVTDTAGLYALRHIPAGAYDLRAYIDRDRDKEADFEEFRDSAFVSLGVNDTAFVNFALLPGDSTPAQLVRAEAVDSLQLRLHFDDFMDPEESLDSVTVTLLELPDSTPVAVGEVIWPDVFEKRQAALRTAAEGDTAGLAVVDSTGAGADTLAVVAAPSVGEAAGADPDAGKVEPDDGGGVAAQDELPPLPTREIVVVPVTPLPHETNFSVIVGGVRNIHGLTGGGGTADFRTPKAPEVPVPADSTSADSLGVEPPDSLPVPDRGGPAGEGAETSPESRPSSSSGLSNAPPVGGDGSARAHPAEALRDPDPVRSGSSPEGGGAELAEVVIALPSSPSRLRGEGGTQR